MLKGFHGILLLTVVGLMVGCIERESALDLTNSESASAEKRRETRKVEGKSDLFIPISATEEILKRDLELKQQGRMRELREQRMVLIQLVKLFKDLEKEQNWQRMHEVIRHQLEAYKNHPLSFAFEQLAGNLMLRKKLLKGEMTQEKREAIAYYTDMLLVRNHEDASVLLPALRQLQQTWSREKLTRAIQTSVNNSSQWVERVTGCRDCSSEQQLSGEAAAVLSDSKRRQVLSVIKATEGLRFFLTELQRP